MFSKSALVLTTAAAIALTSFDLRPAQAAPESGPAIAKQNGADEFSAQRKRRRGSVHPGVPLAAFGMIAGTIAGIAAAERRRDYYERPYYAPYASGGYGYAPQVYAPQVYAHPGYAHPGYAQPGYGYAPNAYGHHPGISQQGDGAPRWGQSPVGTPGGM
jgi:hypothetical protein